MPKTKDFLGSGKYGVVHGICKYAIKHIDDKDVFDAETDANHSLNQVESLRGRMPKFYGIDPKRRLLYLQRINEATLRQALPDDSTLQRIKQHVLETISIMHECGWCHGDVNLNNIFTSGLLFDFSHAYPKSKLSAQAWEDFKKKDRRDIESSYLQAMGLKRLEAAMALIDSGVDRLPRQTELAELLRQSKTSTELLRKLEEISDPTPFLALEIGRAFRREGRPLAGKRLLQNFGIPIPCDDESRRLHIRIRGELALCESFLDGPKACNLFPDVLRSSIDMLGRTDEDTLQLHIMYAMVLERYSRYSSALDILAALNMDRAESLHPWTKLVLRMEERLRDKSAKRSSCVRPTRAKRCLTEDDKENIYRSESDGASKKPKLMQEIDMQKQNAKREDS